MSLNKYFGLFHISTQKNRSAYCYISTKEELQISILLFSDAVASTKVLSADHNAECAYTVQ